MADVKSASFEPIVDTNLFPVDPKRSPQGMIETAQVLHRLRSSSIAEGAATPTTTHEVKTEGLEEGDAVSALFTLHASPLTGPASVAFQHMPPLQLSFFPLPQGASTGRFVANRPRSATWGGTSTGIDLLNFLQVDSDASAAGTLCALMTSNSPLSKPISTAAPPTRPRSQSVALTQHERQQTKGLRPRSSSLVSDESSPAFVPKRSGRPRSLSQSSRTSGRSGYGRKRAMSMESDPGSVREYFSNDDDDMEDGNNGSRVEESRSEVASRVGHYSPNSRRRCIDRFLDKRNRRIWRKRIKYDVRKNFADSRLRVKGRFVRKEDEEQLREYLEMT
jgi:hypothetical protein